MPKINSTWCYVVSAKRQPKNTRWLTRQGSSQKWGFDLILQDDQTHITVKGWHECLAYTMDTQREWFEMLLDSVCVCLHHNHVNIIAIPSDFGNSVASHLLNKRIISSCSSLFRRLTPQIADFAKGQGVSIPWVQPDILGVTSLIQIWKGKRIVPFEAVNPDKWISHAYLMHSHTVCCCSFLPCWIFLGLQPWIFGAKGRLFYSLII